MNYLWWWLTWPIRAFAYGVLRRFFRWLTP
jgi:hypothetical protein